jgi:hypothetical protein
VNAPWTVDVEKIIRYGINDTVPTYTYLTTELKALFDGLGGSPAMVVAHIKLKEATTYTEPTVPTPPATFTEPTPPTAPAAYAEPTVPTVPTYVEDKPLALFDRSLALYRARMEYYSTLNTRWDRELAVYRARMDYYTILMSRWDRELNVYRARMDYARGIVEAKRQQAQMWLDVAKGVVT